MSQSNLKFVNFKTTDSLLLPALFYEPKNKTDKVLLYLHGNGSASVFYSPELANNMGEAMTKKGIAFFTFNNRGANYVKKIKKDSKLNEKVRIGMAYELIKDCSKDIDGAIAYLSRLGYKKFYALGYSTGANKLCVYNYYRPRNIISRFILAGPGDDVGIYYSMWGAKKFNKILKLCTQKIKSGKKLKLVPESLTGDQLISYQSLADTINPNGDYNIFPYLETLDNLNLTQKKKFREYKSIKKPTLVIFGSEEEYVFGRLSEVIEILKKEAPSQKDFTFKIISGGDHGFHGFEKEYSKSIAEWLGEKQ